MSFVNLMQHDCTIMNPEGEVLHVFKGAGAAAATVETETTTTEIDGFSVEETTYGEVKNVLPPVPGVLYIASKLVCSMMEAEGRTDFVSPNTGGTAIRNERKQVVGVMGFTKNA